MEIQGRIKTIFATEAVGANGFQKRDLVITTEEQYPNDILIQFTQQRCDLLNNLKVGQNVRVHFNLRGREWTNQQGEVKYFNTIEGWKIELIQTTNVAQQQHQAPPRLCTTSPRLPTATAIRTASTSTSVPATRATAIPAGANV